jgi:hypothetical protein
MSRLYGLPDKKVVSGKECRRMGIYATSENVLRDASRYKKGGYLTYIMEVPEKNSHWKYGLYIREKGRK